MSLSLSWIRGTDFDLQVITSKYIKYCFTYPVKANLLSLFVSSSVFGFDTIKDTTIVIKF